MGERHHWELLAAVAAVGAHRRVVDGGGLQVRVHEAAHRHGCVVDGKAGELRRGCSGSVWERGRARHVAQQQQQRCEVVRHLRAPVAVTGEGCLPKGSG